MRHKNQTVVARSCPEARERRIHESMTLAFAQVLAPNLVHAPFRPEKTLEYLRQLLAELSFVSPRVGLDSRLRIAASTDTLHLCKAETAGLVIDLEGTYHLHGSPTSLANIISEIFLKRGISCTIGYGPTHGIAWALSRHARRPVSLYTRASIQELPIERLQLSSAISESLHRCGIHSIQDCLQYSSEDLQRRFGSQVVERRSAFLGEREDPVILESEAISFKEQKLFEPALYSLNAIEQQLLVHTRKLLARIEEPGCIARAFSLHIECLNDRMQRYVLHKSLSFHQASYTPRQLEELIKCVLSTFSFPGAVQKIIIEAHHIEPQEHYQVHLSEPSRRKKSDRINRESYVQNLIAHLGHEAVRRMHIEAQLLPEHQGKDIPYSSEIRTEKTQTPILPKEERPTYLLNTPEDLQATALLPDRPPQRIEWKKQQLHIQQALGPERIQTPWWETNVFEQRDYFSVQDHLGRWLWIYRVLPSQQWFLHGLWT